ncbi:1-(5-phosphoribosyl)-5-[(5-phosphoribosylamino)methylideneamino]imidazole-4-carboxamide isomerase [Brevundimonas subvibrioides]|uniref:1-(5-phosphoribosyl)-5-[(5-phosphoribosylamino)methylideneamino] imidazole-4-carboxamide isomerase n=1 Tax=Brevundimonas subvibrioides (strain ATCC 15264 / DSM 4735 / LMG 14903 / NBRC 16000 / CB 81) TaxID=633149 RepID=D9QNR9_BRESC|nr:1-(5-phosphoribosyl)-5-[(5-phosphoribosylamino)methylideneamino]imidazole-4-carboxamide isomerase [Brevundimonas subvibrioides]ADL00352.1 phosphoribosylformimino-5-aminoimidazole carboxamide ribotide isomerase [Brevundimonas subvibrioides ATCC 15264]
MIIYPAIDLRNGVCVRLMHGRFDQVTEYDTVPAARLAAFVAEGATWVHIVDLDGAEAGRAVQHALIGELAGSLSVAIQSGGGVRTLSDVQNLLDAGVSRVVVGSQAVTQPDVVSAWLAEFGADRLTLAFDVRVGEDGVPVPSLKGWTEAAPVDLWTALDRYPSGTVEHVLITDVGRDGALTGPNLDLLAEVIRRRPDLKVQASGGVSSLEDLKAARAIGCDGAIVGRAIYEGRFSARDAIEACA